ncbi:hypothetical protein RJ640_013829 [Escallonia rubra]|uniref:RRM domain-containing protein n=1 Tax=Escallonia rubra TaxID=112253 RepID=A0AA88UM57_9ASTE|nr:hypothetical protein RJ640_013828 [Escallonia rubra]KAK2991569.1 hypothetical protein RJ640_013829 [Escallonia rubra]
MAFFSKAGNILRQSVSKHINKEISASKPSLMQMIRCMSSSKIFVGGLSYNTDETGLRDAFAMYGEVYDARVIVDRETQRSRGFGFVTFATPEDASAAIQALDGKELHGRVVRVNYANDNSRPSFGGGGGYTGDGGAYGGRYAGGGGGGSYGGNSYGGGSYRGGDGYDNGGGSYGGGSVNSYGSGFQNQNIGGVGSNASGGYDGFGQTGSDQLGGSESGSGSGSLADADVGFGQEGNFRDDNDEADGYANKRA